MPNPPDWWLNELAHAGGEHLDANYVATYDAKAGTDPEPDVAVMRRLGLNEESTVVDLGAGTGTFALAVAPHCARVVAVDVSEPMLEVLRQRAANAPGGERVEAVQAGFLTYEHSGPLAGFVYTRNALHHLPDFWKAVALRRVAALLRPGGILRLRDLVYSFPLAETEAAIEAWVAGGAKTSAAGWTRAELAEHVRTEYSTFNGLLETLLDQAGFDVLEAEHSPSRTYSAYTAVRREGGGG